MERLPRGPPVGGAVLLTQARNGTERARDGCPRYQESAVPAAIGNATDELRAARWERRIKLSSASRRRGGCVETTRAGSPENDSRRTPHRGINPLPRAAPDGRRAGLNQYRTYFASSGEIEAVLPSMYSTRTPLKRARTIE